MVKNNGFVVEEEAESRHNLLVPPLGRRRRIPHS